MNRGQAPVSRFAKGFVTIAAVAGAISVGSARAEPVVEITVPGDKTFPESLSSSSDGTIFIGSTTERQIYRVSAGASQAEVWVTAGSNDLKSVLGVLVDEKSETVWACSIDRAPGGSAALKGFDLKTAAPKGSIALPQKGRCNDMAVGQDGMIYAGDSANAQILRAKPTDPNFAVWAKLDVVQPSDVIDGLAFGGDGNLYFNTFRGHGLFRVDMRPDGSAGAAKRIDTSNAVDHPDGMRPFGKNAFLLIEGMSAPVVGQMEGPGRLDLVTVNGDRADIKVLKAGFVRPAAVTLVSNVAWVLESKLNYNSDPSLKDKAASPFKIYAVPVPKD